MLVDVAEQRSGRQDDILAVMHRSFEGDAATLATARRAADGWLAGVGVESEARRWAVVALSELCTNALEAAPGHVYDVTISLQADSFSILVENDGDVSDVPSPEQWSAQRGEAPSGRGLGIVAALAEWVEVSSERPFRIGIEARFRRAITD